MIKPIERLNRAEGGFILLWFSLTTLGLLFAAFTFMLYTEATLSKVKTQYLAMNLTIIGTYNSEFHTAEALNSMAMLAKAEGFSGATATEEVQVFDGGSLFFQHTVEAGETNGVKAYVELGNDPFTQLISSLGSITTSSYSLSKQAPLYVNLAFDYSKSLTGGSIDQLLKGFEVMEDDGSVGPNGEVVDGEVVPNKIIQTYLPHAFEPYLGIVLPWDEPSASWPDPGFPLLSGCSVTRETSCAPFSLMLPTHLQTLKNKASDLFMTYKKTAALLTGVAGRLSPYTDVNIFGGFISSDLENLASDTYSSPFPPLVSNGVYPIHLFDEDLYTNYRLDLDGKITADILEDFSYERPKDLFREPISMAPNRLLQLFLDLTFSRKLTRYATLLDESGNVVANPLTYSELLSPPLPIIEDPGVPTDSFTYLPGNLDINADLGMALNIEIIYGTGWPNRPSPLMQSIGPLYQENALIPYYITHPLEYNCSTGPSIDNAGPLSMDKTNIGYALCRLYATCNPSAPIDCESSIPGAYTSVYQNNLPSSEPNSPLCPAGATARCFDTIGNITNDNTPFCVNGLARCFPNRGLHPKCIDGSENVVGFPQCCLSSGGACGTLWDSTSYPPSYGTHSTATTGNALTNTTKTNPVFRGVLEFPADRGSEGAGTVFHYLMDLSSLDGGTWTQNAVPNTRCAEFKEHFAGLDPECVLVMVTDSRPFGVNSEGKEIKTDVEMLDELTDAVTTFSGSSAGQHNGKIYTWYLDHAPNTFEDLVEQLQAQSDAGTLAAKADQFFNDYIKLELPIPSGNCGAWDAAKPSDSPDCDTYNNTVLVEHLNDAAMYGSFKTLMSTGANLHWTETTLSNTTSGPELPSSFFNGLENLLASLKKEVRFQK